MPTFIDITLPDNSIVHVAAGSVALISRTPPDDAGVWRTLVYCGAGPLQTNETAQTIRQALAPVHVNLVQLTAPGGTPVYLNPDAVSAIGSARPGVNAPEAKSVITVGGQNQAVREDQAAVKAVIYGAGTAT